MNGHDWRAFAELVGQLPEELRREWLAAQVAGEVRRDGGAFEWRRGGTLRWGRFAEVTEYDQAETDDRRSLDPNVMVEGFYKGARIALTGETTAPGSGPF